VMKKQAILEADFVVKCDSNNEFTQIEGRIKSLNSSFASLSLNGLEK
jgi:hypothetical protein